ncbi:hypothetical protein ACHAQJ_008326 [Trichoderma viride]
MSNQDAIPTTQIDVEPGDKTGVYYVTFCNLPFGSKWQELKDWLSGSCIVDFVELFSVSSSGWIRLEGKENFETSLAYIKSQPFKDRHIFFDARNKSEAIKIRVREAGSKPKGVTKYSFVTGRTKDRRLRPWRHAARMRSGSYSKQAPLQESVATPRLLPAPSLTETEDEAVDASSVAEMMAYNDFWTLIWVGYFPPTLVFPGYGWAYCYATNSCTPCLSFYYTIPMLLYPQPEIMMPESIDDDVQSCLDEPQSAAGGRRAQSLPPSFRWAGNETFE